MGRGGCLMGAMRDGGVWVGGDACVWVGDHPRVGVCVLGGGFG